AAVAVVAHRIRSGEGRLAGSWAIDLLGFAAGCCLLFAGLSWRVRFAEVNRLQSDMAGAAARGTANIERLLAPFARAQEKEIAAAVAQGPAALETLRLRNPADPKVLQALVLAYGEQDATLPQAMTVLGELLDLEPEFARDRAVQVLLTKASKSAANREAALSLAVSKMGADGLDLLYEWMQGNRGLKERIAGMLETEGVRDRFSPALAIAYDLRMTETCADKVPLLDRAARVGDERSIALLAPLIEQKKAGCGRYKRSPCTAVCKNQLKEIAVAVRKIRQRLGY
ncbi:MAG: hypothetical protein AAGA56_31125, partial [Myxococcota bacterium]